MKLIQCMSCREMEFHITCKEFFLLGILTLFTFRMYIQFASTKMSVVNNRKKKLIITNFVTSSVVLGTHTDKAVTMLQIAIKFFHIKMYST